MKSFIAQIAIISFLILCLVPQTHAASKSKGKTTNSKKSITLETPFDENIGKLPDKFSGNNLIHIYGALSNNYSKFQKSEFETNEAFQRRMNIFCKNILIGKLKYSDTIAFPFMTTFQSYYDADSQTMTITIPLSSISDTHLNNTISYLINLPLPPEWERANKMDDGLPKYKHQKAKVEGKAIEVFSTLSKTKKYTGTNAFGVKVKITGKIFDSLAVAVKNDYSLMRDRDEITLSFPMTPDKAREAKTTGNILLVGKLLHPFMGNGTSHSSATIDNPVETIDRIRYVATELSGVWYYNTSSGEIYHKQKIEYNPTETVQ